MDRPTMSRAWLPSTERVTEAPTNVSPALMAKLDSGVYMGASLPAKFGCARPPTAASAGAAPSCMTLWWYGPFASASGSAEAGTAAAGTRGAAVASGGSISVSPSLPPGGTSSALPSLCAAPTVLSAECRCACAAGASSCGGVPAGLQGGASAACTAAARRWERSARSTGSPRCRLASCNRLRTAAHFRWLRHQCATSSTIAEGQRKPSGGNATKERKRGNTTERRRGAHCWHAWIKAG